MKVIFFTTILFISFFGIFSVSKITHAQDATQGCCEKVLKTTLKFEAEDMHEEACEELKKDTEKFETVTYYEDKIALLGRCRSANDIDNNSSLPKFYEPDLKVSIPGLIKFKQPEFCKNSNDTKICISWIGQYVGSLANYLFAIVGIVAAITLMVGGVRWLTSAGNSSAVSDAKKWISNSLLGLALTLCAYILLIVINPALVSFSPIKITWLEGISLMNNKKGGGACANGECTQLDEAVTNNSLGISGAILKSIYVGGEGCNPANSTDGFGSCGYSQALPSNRIKLCGLNGDKSDCDLFKRDIQADINCGAKVLMEMAPRCGNFEDINKVARCYNTGGLDKCGTDNYCERVEDYFNNKCGASQSNTNGCCKKANNTYETTTANQCTKAAQGQDVEFFPGQVAMGDHCEPAN